MAVTPKEETTGWRTMTVLGAVIAPLASVLWLGLAINAGTTPFALTIAKIVFVMIVVGVGVLGVRWPTAAGVTLGLQMLAALLWVVLRMEAYPPYGLMRTIVLLIVPLALSSALLILADGVRAGTWPPHRFRARP